MASRTWDAEAGDWRVQIPGTDRTYLANSDEGRALESAWEQQAQAKRDAHFANVGNWQQYEGGTLEDFTSALNQDPFFAARLPNYARDVMNGDTYGYNMEFQLSNANTAKGHELTNRYIALLNQGYTDQEIMGAGYGNDGSSWSNVGSPAGGNESTPAVDMSNYTPLQVGTGFLGAYNAKREELANKPSVMSLFKEMKDYEQPPQ